MEKFRDLADPNWERRINSFEETYLTANPANYSGIDPSEKTDSTVGLEAALKDAITKEVGLYIPGGKYLIGSRGTGIDLRKLLPAKVRTEGFELICAANANFIGAKALGESGRENPVFIIGAPKEGKLVGSYIKLGRVKSSIGTSDCVWITGLFNSFVHISTLEGTGAAAENSKGLLCDATKEPTSTSSIVGNNEIHVTNILELGWGIATLGNAFAEPNIQVSGNVFIVSEIIKMLKNGIAPDANGTGHNTEWNSFYVGDIENCTENAIVDANGNNRYMVGSTNANSTSTFNLPSGALAGSHNKSPPYVRVSSLDTVPFVLNGQPADVCNLLTGELGWIELEEVNANLKLGESFAGASAKAQVALSDGVAHVYIVGKTSAEITAAGILAKVPPALRPKVTHVAPLVSSTTAEAGAGIEVALTTGKIKTIKKIEAAKTVGAEFSYPVGPSE